MYDRVNIILTAKSVSQDIILIVPNAVEDEEKLDEDAAKGQNSTHYNTRDGLGKERLLRDLTRDLVGSHWLLNCLKR